jgi:hypothetical protein
MGNGSERMKLAGEKARKALAETALKIAGLKIGQVIPIPETYKDQVSDNRFLVNNVRLEADRKGLHGESRKAKVTSVFVNTRDYRGTWVSISGRLPNKDGSWCKKETLIAAVED